MISYAFGGYSRADSEEISFDLKDLSQEDAARGH